MCYKLGVPIAAFDSMCCNTVRALAAMEATVPVSALWRGYGDSREITIQFPVRWLILAIVQNTLMQPRVTVHQTTDIGPLTIARSVTEVPRGIQLDLLVMGECE